MTRIRVRQKFTSLSGGLNAICEVRSRRDDPQLPYCERSLRIRSFDERDFFTIRRITCERDVIKLIGIQLLNNFPVALCKPKLTSLTHATRESKREITIA